MDPEPRPEDHRLDMGALLGAVVSRWLRLLLVTALILAVTLGILLLIPRQYESTTTIVIEPLVAAGQPADASVPVGTILSRHIEFLRSPDTLLAVIDRQKLRSVPEFTGMDLSPLTLVQQLVGGAPAPAGVEERVLKNLDDRLDIVRGSEPGTISIRVRSENPQLAASLANDIAAHVVPRPELGIDGDEAAPDGQESEIARLRLEAEQAEAALEAYRLENELVSVSVDGADLEQQLASISNQIASSQERRATAEVRGRLLRELIASGQPLDGMQEVRNSAIIQQLSQTRAGLQGELAQRSSTLLPNHPTIRSLNTQIREIDAQITAEARRVADALDAEAKIEADLEASLREDFARLQRAVPGSTGDPETLEQLTRAAREKRDLLEYYHAGTVKETPPDTGSAPAYEVRQIGVATPSDEPISPQPDMVLGAVGVLALALQIGGILFGELMSGRALVSRSHGRRVEEPDEEPPVIADLFDLPYDPDDRDDDEAETGDGDLEFVTDETLGDDVELHRPVDQEASPGALAPEPDLSPGFDTVDEFLTPPPARPGARGDDAFELSNLSADIAIGRVRVVLLAGLADSHGCEAVAEVLVADAVRRGLSVVMIDAASGRPSSEPGITDLSHNRVGFGDVVHQQRDGLAEVPWGQEAMLDRHSPRPRTLVEALTDIYEVVIVLTGRIGMASTLPMFAGIPCRMVLVSPPRPEPASLETAIEDAADLGFEVGQIVRLPQRLTELA